MATLRAVVDRRGRVSVAIAAVAAILLASCGVLRRLRPGSASTLRVEVTTGRDGFDWASPSDQARCASARGYPAEVASVLREALGDDCTFCQGRRLRLRLFVLNDPVGQRASVMSLVLLSPDPEGSGATLDALSRVLGEARLPPVPLRRPRCTLEVSIAPPRSS
jgi:hypothetical protein